MGAALTSESNGVIFSRCTNSLVECDEQKLVEAANGGSLPAFENLVERYRDKASDGGAVQDELPVRYTSRATYKAQ